MKGSAVTRDVTRAPVSCATSLKALRSLPVHPARMQEPSFNASSRCDCSPRASAFLRIGWRHGTAPRDVFPWWLLLVHVPDRHPANGNGAHLGHLLAQRRHSGFEAEGRTGPRLRCTSARPPSQASPTPEPGVSRGPFPGHSPPCCSMWCTADFKARARRHEAVTQARRGGHFAPAVGLCR